MSAEHKHSINRVQTLSHSNAVYSAHIRAIDHVTAAILVVVLGNADVCIYRTRLTHKKPIQFHLLKRLHAHGDSLNTAFIHPTKPLFVTASEDYTVKVWTLKSGTVIKCIVHPASVYYVKYSPSGLLATSCEGGLLRVYGVEPLFSLRWSCQLSKATYGIAWSPSNHLAAMYGGFQVRVWDTAFHTVFQHKLVNASCYYGSGYGLVFPSDDLLLCSGGKSGILYSCNIPNSTVTAHKPKNGKAVRAVTALSSEIVCVSYDDDTLLVYEVHGTELRLLATLPLTESHFLASCVCPYKDAGYVLASADWSSDSNDVLISVTSRFNRYWVQEVTKIVLNSTILPFCTDVDKIILQYLR